MLTTTLKLTVTENLATTSTVVETDTLAMDMTMYKYEDTESTVQNTITTQGSAATIDLTVTEKMISTATETGVIQLSVITVTTTNMVDSSEDIVSFQSYADLPPTNTPNSVPDRLQTGCSPFGAGAVIAVVLGVILLVQLIACTVAWAVCLKRKQERRKREGTGMLGLSNRTTGYNGPSFSSTCQAFPAGQSRIVLFHALDGVICRQMNATNAAQNGAVTYELESAIFRGPYEYDMVST